MQETVETVPMIAPALRVLLANVIDYAGIFPPAKLPLDETISNYESYKSSHFSWMLHWLVLSAEQATELPGALLSATSLVTQSDEVGAAALETKTPLKVRKPVYCETAPGDTQQLDEVKIANCYAKIRTGGVVPSAIPGTNDVAKFIIDCAERKLAFKATAGLHHPVRAEYPLTYEVDAPRAVMHGFLNVLLAASFAWQGERDVEPILADTDASNFRFDDRAHWRNKSLSVEQIEDARRNFIHSIGSCSFEEPIEDLRRLKFFQP